jgi:hypothetical protein
MHYLDMLNERKVVFHKDYLTRIHTLKENLLIATVWTATMMGLWAAFIYKW